MKDIIKYRGGGKLITVSFYALEGDYPYGAGVTICRLLAGATGKGSHTAEKWLPVYRADALALVKHLGETVSCTWINGDRTAVVTPGDQFRD
ncbi:MAG: hypothetical protein EBY29_13700 [Planctomycetes bacterium]|jgi:hypothetical protein|nr:hypothetical protein [Planctomycetota bacterium]